MVKPELGTKRTCPGCGARFYDLHKTPAECPKCGETFIPETLLPSKETVPKEVKAADAPQPKDAETAEDTGDVEVVSLEEVEADDAADDDDEIAAIEDVDLGDDDVEDDDSDDDTFLESDSEDDSDVSGLIGGVSGEDEDS